jgi:hypothetical protein
MDPIVPPAVRVTAIVAAGNAQIEVPSWAKVNFTGTTPRLTLKMLVPFALIGCWTCAPYLNLAITNGLRDDTLA